ncbi:MAG: polyphosphate kinase 1 [Defluviitaleaceae bacterium]|nr:polyphosphate kinase 1 [Defluviitaleaceae bacterium]
MPFNNRELSWLDFNSRVLAEAQSPENLPLDRLFFLAITASNLDEFYMVRMAYIRDQEKYDFTPDDSGMTPKEQLEKILERGNSFQMRQAECYMEISSLLRESGIDICKMSDLSEQQTTFARDLFDKEILPVITPLAVDPSRPFPFLSNNTMNICVRMIDEEGNNVYAVIPVPPILPRFIRIQSGAVQPFLPIEELIANYLPVICDLHKIAAYGYFCVIRSADFDADEDTDNLLEEMKRTLKKRKRGKPIRLELSKNFDDELCDFLSNMLGIGKRFVIQLPGLLNLSALREIAGHKELGNLRRNPIVPVPASDFVGHDDIFAAIRERDRMVHLPYESFDCVADFVKSATNDSRVLAIKQTLYRASGRGEIIAALEQAAEAGKEVTVLVELKARFDEENNIQWAARLERAGCHVIYGLTGLKTHCKITLVVRREEGGIRRYVHLSTGNYNDVTARIYTDIGMFTCRPAFGADASALFNHLTGFSNPPEYNKLIVAPKKMKQFFLDKIEDEIQNAKKKLPCGISIKINSILDGTVVRKLYEASSAGVPVSLMVRGICSLVPGVEGCSENIRVHSVLGQLLEHSRIYVFENAGDPQFYLSSADLMPRNLDRRVEVAFPVEEPLLKSRLRKILDTMWRDSSGSWRLGPDGEYRRVEAKGGRVINSQRELARMAMKAFKNLYS